MGLFSRRVTKVTEAPSIAAELVLSQTLAEFGRYAIARIGSTDLHAVVRLMASKVDLIGDDPTFAALGDGTSGPGLYRLAESRPDRLYQILRRVVAPEGGWAAVGAMYFADDVVDAIYGSRESPNEDFEVVMELATDFLRARHIPWLEALTPAQQIWFRKAHPNTEWISRRAVPEPTGIGAQTLEPREARLIAQFGPGRFRLVARLEPGGEYAAYREDPVDGGWQRTPEAVAQAGDLPHLYWEIAQAIPVAPKWWVPELEAMYPFPSPDYH